MSRQPNKNTIHKAAVLTIVPNANQEQINRLFTTEQGSNRPVVNKQTVIDTLGLTDQQATDVLNFEYKSKDEIAIKDLTDAVLSKKITDLKKEIEQLIEEYKKYKEEDDSRKVLKINL
jgi:spore maturation protein CgeB